MRDYLLVKTIKGVRKVPLKEIHYLLRKGRKIHIFSDQGEISFNETMAEVEKSLDERFFKAMDCCYINLDRIRMAEEGRIVFDDESSLLLSRDTYVRTKQKLYLFLKEGSFYS